MDLSNSLYHVKAKEEDSAKILIRFLECPFLHYKEVGIFNSNIKEKPKFGHVFPEDLYYAEYYDDNIPTEDELQEALEKNDFMFSGVAALDEEDENRITLSFLGKKSLKMLPFCKDRFMLSTMNAQTDKETVHKIISYLENQ